MPIARPARIRAGVVDQDRLRTLGGLDQRTVPGVDLQLVELGDHGIRDLGDAQVLPAAGDSW
jgi:hypothetical protein